MSVIKILHAADLHLDSPFEALSAEKAAQRRREQRELLYALSDLARTEEADLVLLAGDLLDSDSIYSETAAGLSRCLASIPAPVFISPGNHDYYTPFSPWENTDFGANVHIFKKNRLECVKVSNLPVLVFGAAFTERRSAPLLEGISVQRQEGLLNIMCIHCDPEGGSDSPYNPVTKEQLAGSGMDYVAMGHIHQGSELKKAGDTYYAWPGCPEGRGFDETGFRFVYIAQIDTETRLTTLSRKSIALRKYQDIAVDVTDGEPLLKIHSALPEDTARDIYRITLTGKTDAPPDIKKLYRELEGMFFALQLRDRTRFKENLWEKAGEDSLRGLFLKKMKLRLEAASSEEERLKIEKAARWGLAALNNSEEVSGDDY